jgi:hypothetical protein
MSIPIVHGWIRGHLEGLRTFLVGCCCPPAATATGARQQGGAPPGRDFVRRQRIDFLYFPPLTKCHNKTPWFFLSLLRSLFPWAIINLFPSKIRDAQISSPLPRPLISFLSCISGKLIALPLSDLLMFQGHAFVPQFPISLNLIILHTIQAQESHKSFTDACAVASSRLHQNHLAVISKASK